MTQPNLKDLMWGEGSTPKIYNMAKEIYLKRKSKTNIIELN